MERPCSYEVEGPPGGNSELTPHSTVLEAGLGAGSPSSSSILGRFKSRSWSFSASRSGRLRPFEGLPLVLESEL